MFQQMERDIQDFYNAADEFIQNRKKLIHPVEICSHCGTVIEADQPLVKADELPYHEECFREIIGG